MVNITTLDNGLRIVTQKMPGLETVSMGIWNFVGGRDELANINGVAHLLEHMAFKGTASRSALEIAETIENVGGDINAYTSKEITAYYVKLIADTEREILQIQGIVDESALFHPSLSLKTSITVSPHSSRITVADTIVNNQSTSAELELLYHCNFGPPFMNENSRIVLPFHSIAPRDQRACENIGNTKEEALTKITSCPGPTKGYIEQVYFCKPASLPDDSATLAALVNSKAEHAAVIRYNSAQLPCLTLWKNTASENEGYVVGIEPATDYPNCRPVEREAGRVISLSPGESYTTQLMFEIAEGEEAVTNVLAEIAQIQDEASGEINLTPIE